MSYRVMYDEDARASHRVAMEAKQLVFQAQDLASRMRLPDLPHAKLDQTLPDWRKRKKFHDRVRADLARARAALEALDTAMLDAHWEDGGHCSCQAFGNARPHEQTCPLWDPSDPPQR